MFKQIVIENHLYGFVGLTLLGTLASGKLSNSQKFHTQFQSMEGAEGRKGEENIPEVRARQIE